MRRFAEEEGEFAEPEDEGRGRDDNQQIQGAGGVEGYGVVKLWCRGECVEEGAAVEEVEADLCDEQLPGDYYGDYSPETAAHGQTEDALAGLEGARVEHVPEVGPHEDGEEQRGLIGCHFGWRACRPPESAGEKLWDRGDVGVVEEPVEEDGDGEEDNAYGCQLDAHRARQYRGLARSGTVEHHLLGGRERREGHGAESIHD